MAGATMEMDDATNGHQPPAGSSPAPTPEGRARLLAALDLGRARHAVDVGQLGEYVELLDRDGLAATRARLPAVAAHLATGCAACNAEVGALRELSALDADPSESPRLGALEVVDEGRLGWSADGSGRASADVERFGRSADVVGVAASEPAATPASRGRQHRMLTTGLIAVAAGALVLMGATLYSLLSIAPGGGTGEVKLIARETLAAPTAGTIGAPAAPPTMVPTLVPAAVPVGQPTVAPPTVAASPSASPAAAGTAAPQGMECPASQPIKANRQSGIYHVRGGECYDRTRPEVCFATPEDAERAGFRRSQR